MGQNGAARTAKNPTAARREQTPRRLAQGAILPVRTFCQNPQRSPGQLMHPMGQRRPRNPRRNKNPLRQTSDTRDRNQRVGSSFAHLRTVDRLEDGTGDPPIEIAVIVPIFCIFRPKGRRTERAPFFYAARMPHRKIPSMSPTAGLLWHSRVFFGYFLDSRLRRSPSYQVRGRLFGPASPFAPQAAQCDKELLSIASPASPAALDPSVRSLMSTASTR